VIPATPAHVHDRKSSLSRTSHRVHVLFVIDQLCQMGGAERILIDMIHLLPADRFLCSVVTFKIDPALGIFDGFPCVLNVLPLERTYGAHAWKVAWQLNRFIRQQDVRIVHTFFETSDLWGGLIAKLSGCPLLVSSRRDMGILRGAKHRLAYRVGGRLFDEVQTVSEQVRQFCIKQDRLSSSKVRTIYNGVATGRRPVAEKLLQLRETIGIPHGTRVVTTLGHVRHIKGCDILIRAAAEVCRQEPSVLFLIAGENHEPTHYAQLVHLIQTLGLQQQVRLLGGVRDTCELLSLSHVFCLPSRSEGLSNALLEAMALGLPAVVTNVGGNPELIQHGCNGYLVPPESAGELAKALLDVVRAPEKAEAMGHEGRRVVTANFTQEKMRDNLVSSYERLLRKHGM
jgi:glycosyltransferase involved in cell wall biosynthesis